MKLPLTAKELNLIQFLLEERIAWVKKSREYVNAEWKTATKVEKQNKLNELQGHQNLAESASGICGN